MRSKTKVVKYTQFSLPHKLSFEQQDKAKALVNEAVAKNKIFMIQGPYSSIRSCLRERGWVEKFYRFSGHNENLLESSEKVEENDDIDYNHTNHEPPWKEEDGLYAYMHRLLHHTEPNLLWGIRKDAFKNSLISSHQLLNHFSNCMFTTKVGLNKHLQESHWHDQEPCHYFYPRVYQLVQTDERLTFQTDFIQTACVSLLKIIHSANADNVTDAGKVPELTIPDDVFTQALNTCVQHVAFLTHNDIDCNLDHVIVPEDFRQLLSVYYRARRHQGVVAPANALRLQEVEWVLEELKRLSPQHCIDGSKNVWILKPGAKSRGRGVACFDTLDSILELVQSHVMTNEKKYVLQKYIETPLLIYDTKFDIRQWFLVTDWNPLTIWMYRPSYLRFCSRSFSLDDLEASIHLTNNSIQKNCPNQEGRSQHLPANNMWTCQQLEEHLLQEGGQAWEEGVYRGMKEAILSAMKCCQGDVDHRKNSFELYGADFMLDEGHKAWLLEINSSPCMSPSTEVTAHLCPRVLQDTFKVVLDYKEDKNASTGDFELFYRQSAVEVPSPTGLAMEVKGRTISGGAFSQDPRLSGPPSERSSGLLERPKERTVTLPTLSSIYRSVGKVREMSRDDGEGVGRRGEGGGRGGGGGGGGRRGRRRESGGVKKKKRTRSSNKSSLSMAAAMADNNNNNNKTNNNNNNNNNSIIKNCKHENSNKKDEIHKRRRHVKKVKIRNEGFIMKREGIVEEEGSKAEERKGEERKGGGRKGEERKGGGRKGEERKGGGRESSVKMTSLIVPAQVNGSKLLGNRSPMKTHVRKGRKAGEKDISRLKVKLNQRFDEVATEKCQRKMEMLNLEKIDLEDERACEKVFTYIQHFYHAESSLLQLPSLPQQPPSYSPLPSMQHLNKLTGNWSAFRLPSKARTFRSSSMTSTSPTDDSSTDSAPKPLLHTRPSSHLCRLSTGARTFPTPQKHSNDPPIKLTLQGRRALMM